MIRPARDPGRERAAGMERVERPQIEGVLDDLLPLVKDRRDAPLRNILLDLHPADVAAFIGSLRDEDDRRYVFGLLTEPEIASAVLTELSGPAREDITQDLHHDAIADLVEEMSTDDAADVLQELAPERASKVLEGMGAEEAAAMRPLLGYDEESAGGIMDAEVLTVPLGATVGEAREVVRARSEEAEPFFFVFVVDDEGRLRGTLSLRTLVLKHSGTPVVEAMDTQPVTVPPDMDQERVAEIFRRYDLLSVPVVDAKGRLLGRITVDDVVDVMREEAEEDIARMVGTDEEEFDESSVRRIAFLRLPWILTSLAGGLFAGAVLRHFTGTLGLVAVFLVSFVPVITAMAGNAGSQAATIMVRRLALRPVGAREMGSIVVRETRVGLLVGLICGVVAGTTAVIFKGIWLYGVVVSAAMIAAILVAAILGTTAPVFFRRVRVDPAVATGPFVSMTNDVVGLLIYFGLAVLLLGLAGEIGP